MGEIRPKTCKGVGITWEVFRSITRERVVHSPSGVPKQPHSPSRGDLPKRLEELFL